MSNKTWNAEVRQIKRDLAKKKPIQQELYMAKKLSGWLIDEIFDSLKTPTRYTEKDRVNRQESKSKNIIGHYVPVDEYVIII